MSIQFEYFYGSQAEQFSFYRIPKVLFTDEMLAGISVEAKVLYSFMLDRMSLSVKNCWFDEENRVYIIYTIDDILSDFGCARQKALKLLDELESGIGLIERKRQGFGRPNIIYVKNFIHNPKEKRYENQTTESMNIVSGKGINKRLFARWLNLKNLNNMNLLLEYGLIQENEFHKISLHPLIKEITIDDKEPGIKNCKAFIKNIHGEYLLHGIDLPYYKTMFDITENIIYIADKDDIEIYKAFIKDAFAYMEKYAYKSGMSLIISELEQYSESVDDTALILDYKSAYEHIINDDMQKSAEYEMQAVNLCDSLTNPHLKANIYANMGGLYHAEGELLKAKEFMEKAYRILTENNLQYTADSVTQICNYASLAANMGEPQRAIQALEKGTEHIIPNTIIHAELLENIGLIYLQINDIPNAKEKLTQSLNIYSEIWEDSPELTEQKISEIKEQIFLLNNSITEN